MSIGTIAAKNAPVVAPLTFATIASAEITTEIIAVVAGLAFGAMWRAANLRNEGKAWRAVRSDIGISIMVGGANAVLALTLVEWLDVSKMAAMAIGVVVGATGLRAVPEAKDMLINALRRKLIGDDIVYMPPEQQNRLNDTMDRLKQED